MSKNMNILYFNQSLNVSIGGGTHAREALAALRRIPDTTVSVFPQEEVSALAKTEKKTFSKGFWVPKQVLLWAVVWVKPLKKETAQIPRSSTPPYDVIFYRPNGFLRLIPEVKKLHPKSHLCVEINSLIHCERLKNLPPRSFWVRREASLINKADSIMVVTGWLRDQLVACGVPAEKILVNPNGANLQHFSPRDRDIKAAARAKLCIPESAFVFGYVGGMETFRKLPLMVRQMKEVLEEEELVHLVIAGDGEDRPEIDRVLCTMSVPIRARIHLTGSVPYQSVPDLISTFDCALFPYTNPYVSPLKLFEYMAAHKPVIGPDIPGVREVFKEQEHVLLVDQKKRNLKQAARFLLDHRDAADEMAAKGRDFVMKNYTWDKNAERLFDFWLQKV